MKNKSPIEPRINEFVEFRPRLGKFGAREKPLTALSYLRQAKTKVRTRVNSNRYAKGGSSIRFGSTSNQRVLIKARVVKGRGTQKTLSNLKAHIQYLSRSGVSEDKEIAKFFSKEGELSKNEVKQIISTWGEDLHHFRFIISPENAAELDLKEFTQSTLRGLENDLKDTLNWFAVCHYNTDNPHIHVVLRGVGNDRKPLIIDKNYIRYGFRELAQKEATRRLGFRSETQLEEGLKRDVASLSWTSIDWRIKEELEKSIDGLYRLPRVDNTKTELQKIQRQIKFQRLTFLKELGLCTEKISGVWQIAPDSKEILDELSRRKTIKGLVQKHLNIKQVVQPLIIHDSNTKLNSSVIGEVLGVGFKDSFQTSKYILVSGIDGRLHFFEPSKFSIPEGFLVRKGQLITVEDSSQRKVADEVIFKFSQKQNRVFDENLFKETVENKVKDKTWKIPKDLTIDEYLERFSTRIVTLKDAGLIKEIDKNKYEVSEDLFEKVEELDKKLGKKEYIKVDIKSHLSFTQQINHKGATWLDSIKQNSKNFTNQTLLGNEIYQSIELREKFLDKFGLSKDEKTFESLKKQELLTVTNKLKKRYGEVITLNGAKDLKGKVLRYKLLGTGYHQILRVKNGFAIREVLPREAKFQRGQEVLLDQTKQGLTVKVTQSKNNKNLDTQISLGRK